MFPSALTNSRVARTISRHVYGNQRPRIVRSAAIRVLVSTTSWNNSLLHELSSRDKYLEAEMKALIGCAAILFALATVTSAEARGCVELYAEALDGGEPVRHAMVRGESLAGQSGWCYVVTVRADRPAGGLSARVKPSQPPPSLPPSA